MATPTPKPTTSANMGPVVTGANKVKTPKTTSTDPKTTTTDDTLRQLPGGVLTNWEAFLNNDLTYQPAGTSKGGVQSEPYISMGPVKGDSTPNAVALVASPDGRGYQVKGIDAAVREYIKSIPKNQMANYKYQLSAYYNGGATGSEYKNSIRQIITERDLGFEGAVRNAVSSLSVENFNRGKEEALILRANPDQVATHRTGLYNFDTYVGSRQPGIIPSTVSQRQSSLTLEADAKAEFRRTVQQYVGDPALVDKVDKLADSYWKKLHAEELKRNSSGMSTTDPLTGLTTQSGFSYAQLSEQDRVEMRLNFIVKGDKKIESVGLRQASQEDLEEAGGVIGASYGKLNKIAADYGVQLTHEDLLERVNRAIKPGGVTTGVSPDTMNTGLTAEENSIKTSAKIRFKALAPYIDQGLKVSDISSNFQRLKEKEYGLADNSINIYDDDVMKALSGDGIASTNDFLLGVRSNPLWRKTPKANEMAAEFLNTILKSWGKVG